MASLTAGYLFVMNNYLPMYICLAFLIISLILSFKFKEVGEVKRAEETSPKKILKQYKKDLKEAFKFISKSNRMKAYILFQIAFYGLIKIITTYRGDLLVNIGVPEEQFSMIFAVLTLMGGLSLGLIKNIEKKFKNRTLTFISLMYVGACIVIGVVLKINASKNIIPIILVMYVIQEINLSFWEILEFKYLKNFTTEDMRNKITFCYELIGAASSSIFSILGGLLLKVVSIENAFLIIGLVFLIIMVLVLDYMRTRFGLKPNEYKKEDIEFESNKIE